MDDWLRNLPGELAYTFIGWLLLEAAKQAYKDRKWLIGRGKSIPVTVADRVGISDSHTQTLTGGGIEGHAASVGGGTLVGSFPKKRSTAEELFWWYWRIRLS